MTQTNITLPVRGMTCASCVAHVARGLRGVEGVAEVNVNLATEKATVGFAGGSVATEELVRAVRDRSEFRHR